MATLAIKGHETRGKEIIEILEMLGGRNCLDLEGDDDSAIYCIGSDGWIGCHYIKVEDVSDCKVFTLEEFLEKYPYLVGDMVQHKGATSLGSIYVIVKMGWIENQVEYTITIQHGCSKHKVHAEELQPYKEEEVEYKLYVDREKIIKSFTLSMEENKKIIFDKKTAPNETELVFGDDFELIQKDGRWFVIRKENNL